MNYHNLSTNQTFDKLKTSKKGLSQKQAEKRLEKYGLNQIKEKKTISPWSIFLSQFKSFVILILLVVMLISVFLHEWTEAIAVGAILIFNAIFGFVQEYKAEKAIEALKNMASPKAKVIRDGKKVQIDSKDVVPGDILSIDTGDKIPADARIIESIGLETQEAALTGESLPVQKTIKSVPEKTILGNRKNMLFAGTIVTKGRAKAVVTATGMTTEFGKIAEMIQESPEEPTHLQVKLKELGHTLGIITIVISIIIFLVGVLTGNEAVEMLVNSISLAVAAIPEGLPAVVTISLALGVQRMVKKNALVRRLPSVETLGSTTVICTDKTGTLTHNEMTVKKLFVNNEIVEVTGSGYSTKGKFSKDSSQFELLLKIGALNNDAILQKGKVVGDPTEGCLIVSAAKAGLNKEKLEKQNLRVDEIPFDSERKLMTTVHKTSEGKVAYTKGAPDIILEFCNRILVDGKVKRLTQLMKKKILKHEDEFAKQALRVLGFAYKKSQSKPDEKDMVFVGLQAMIDPPRQEVKDSIAKCKKAGIKVVMVTGDYKLTAKAIAKELGIEGIAITGEDLDKIENLEEHVEDIGICARVNPEHKMRIINALKKKGHVVAMTGDGVNDAPALKKADIGISMGITGTDVAKEASDMVLTDDNFTSIVNAVEEGRGIYNSIKNFVQYTLSSNLGEILVILLAILIGWPLPIVAIQILWVNLLTDGLPGLALSLDPFSKEVMKKPPRKKKEPIITRGVIYNILIVGTVMGIGTLLMFYLYGIGSMKAKSVAFTTLIMFQLFNALSFRAKNFLLNIKESKFIISSVIISVLLQFAILYTPLSEVFETVPLSALEWVYIVLVSSSLYFILQAIQKLRKSRQLQND
ncbi:MAG: Potassium-transporting ATPase ATP-binding subunit [Candidatus Woesearchaeota archaeon]|nr:Potassium-transporting ATPase ATP-binding subunit [Candidatus Woesearchaeota archaeon]